MAKITALKQQKKNSRRINVYLDGDFSFGLSRIVAGWLHVGQEINEKKIAELQASDEDEVALQKALRFLSYRTRTEQEVSRKLERNGYEPAIVAEVIERLKQSQMLNDEEFSKRWVENRVTLRPRSHRMMAMELRQKGILEKEIDLALDQAPDDEVLAYQSGKTRLRRYASLDWQEFRKKLSAYLGRKGFSYGAISPVVKQLWEELQASVEPGGNCEEFSSKIK